MWGEKQIGSKAERKKNKENRHAAQKMRKGKEDKIGRKNILWKEVGRERIAVRSQTKGRYAWETRVSGRKDGKKKKGKRKGMKVTEEAYGMKGRKGRRCKGRVTKCVAKRNE